MLATYNVGHYFIFEVDVNINFFFYIFIYYYDDYKNLKGITIMEILSLSELWEALLAGRVSAHDARDMLDTGLFRKTINAFLNSEYMSNNAVFASDESMETLVYIVNILQYIYNNTDVESPISDSEYDKLYEMMNFETGKSLSGSPLATTNRYTAKHKYPVLRGTLSKVYYLRDCKRTNPSRKFLSEWIKSKEDDYYQKTGNRINLSNVDVYVFPKWDGVSAIQECDCDDRTIKWLTRGDTSRNEACDISSALSQFNVGNVESATYHGVKYEVMMAEAKKDEYNEIYNCDYKNTRSIVSAIINSGEIDDRTTAYLKPIPLRYINDGDEIQSLHPMVFDYPYIKCKMRDIDSIDDFANSHKYIDGLRTDGAVIYIIDTDIQKILGRDNDKSNFEVAYKFTEESAKTKLRRVEFSVKNFGHITPIAVVAPVKLKGNTITKISLGNKGRFDKLSLSIDDDVKVLYDIIPYLIIDGDCHHNKHGMPIEFPLVCPECCSEISFVGPIAKCTNVECPSRVIGRISNYLIKMNIKNISYATIKTLNAAGLLNGVKDLYKLRKKTDKILKIPGFGDQSVRNLIHEIDARRDVYDYEVLGALGIEDIATKTFKKICSTFSMYDIVEMITKEKWGKLLSIQGIQEKSLDKITTGLKRNSKIIEFLCNELNIMESSQVKNGPEVVFTKIRDIEFEAELEKAGFTISDSASKRTKYVVAPSHDTSSSKVTYANKHGVPVVTIEELKRELNM